jgi:tetratricopeptide (TPR) repeat protein
MPAVIYIGAIIFAIATAQLSRNNVQFGKPPARMRMRRHLQHHFFKAHGWRSSAGVLAAVAAIAWPAWGADSAPATSASPAPAPAADTTNAPTPASGPEASVRDTLVAFLQKMEPDRLNDISAFSLDRDQANARIKIFEETGRFPDLADTYLYYLTKLPPDPQDYLDMLAGLNKVLEQNVDDNGLLTLTFELADQFPPAAEGVQQIRLRQAEYLLRMGGAEAALSILHRLIDQPETVPALRAQAAGTAGFLHEHMGQTEEAITAYRQAGQDLSAGLPSGEAMLRASLLLLELRRTDEALAVLNQLRAAPADVLSQYEAAAPAIKDMLDLTADPQQAQAYWEHQQDWLAQWSALGEKLGVKSPTAGAPLLAAYIDNYPQLTAQAGLALRQADATAFFQAVDQFFQAGRWHPADLGEAASILYQGMALAPDETADIFALGAALEKDLPPAEKDLIQQLAQSRIAAMVDDAAGKERKGDDDGAIAENTQARDIAQALLDKYGADGAAGQALARLYGLVVVRSNSTPKFGEQAVRILADTLADPAAHGSQRLMAVAVLSDLYASLGRDDDERILLEKELAKPADPADPNAATRQALQIALENLKQRTLQGAGLDAGLSSWWQDHPLPWYDYATSKSQAGPLSTVDDPVVEVTRDFNRALDSTASFSVRVVALEMALNGYPEMFATGSALADGANAFVSRSEIPNELRYLAWYQTELHLFVSGQRDAAEKMLANSPYDSATSADDSADFTLWDNYLAQPNTVAAQQAFAQQVLALPDIRHPSVLLLAHIINTLANLNAVDAAQAIFNQLGQAKLISDAAQDYRDLKDSVGPMLDTYKAVLPVAEAMRQFILDSQTPDAVAAAQFPAVWHDLNDPWEPSLSLLTQDETRQGLLVFIRDRLPYGRHPLQVFMDYAETLSFNPTDSALRMKLFETAQKLATRDDDRFYAACFFSSVVDFDNPDVARRGWADLAPARAAEFPKAGGFIQYYDTLMKWRTGQTINPAADFGPLDAANFDPFKLRLVFDYYLQQGDRDNLQKLIAARPEQDFLQQPVLGGYLKALRLLNKAAALTRATDAAHLEAAKDIVAGWALPDLDTVEPVFDLARALDDPKLYPREWITGLLGAMRNENSRDLVRMEDARLQGDWAGALDAANSYLARNPTNYDAYWNQAQALVQLGRRPEALEPLRIYVKYSHNDDYYPQAVELLKSIEAETKTPAAAANP